MILIVSALILALASLSLLFLFSRHTSTTDNTAATLPLAPELNEMTNTNTATFSNVSTTNPTEPKKSAPAVTANPLSPTTNSSLPTDYELPTFTDLPYIEFVDPSGFVNSDPFALADYIGKKIIVLEFITYSCINCQRTFPYLIDWHKKYADDGVLVIGIHTPEFAFEHDIDNVRDAMQKEGITFPIVLDNDYRTWRAYNNHYWPHRYIIDLNGNIVWDHVGEGKYDETELVINKLLLDKAKQQLDDMSS